MDAAKRTIETTVDGSHTVAVNGITYHSHHGAIQESKHVFIRAGLEVAEERFPERELNVFEMGFGTGLNALLTALRAEEAKRHVFYNVVEFYPLQEAEWTALNYGAVLNSQSLFEQIHTAPWNETIATTPAFTIKKQQTSLLDWEPDEGLQYHLVYFDAFAPDDQPELWTEEIFRKLYNCMHPNGILVTYCAKGYVRRNMMAAGFTVERIPGPPGKRQMLRAVKE